MVMPTASPKKKGSKTSSYTYTGCWTCRRRHIKCDEGKPSCNRCIKAGFECAGYDFRFAGSDSSRSFRRPVAQNNTGHQAPALSSAKVNAFLEYLDTATTTTAQGPFSVLSFSNECLTSTEPPKAAGVAQHKDAVDEPYDSSYELQHGLTTPPREAFELMPAIKSLQRKHSISIPRQLRLLSVPSRQAELFEHWTTFLCLHMSPLSESSTNPFRYLYPSLALEGLTVTPDMGAARLAVFHGICGTAAWSMSKLRPDDESYRSLSVNHDQLALQYIQRTIEQPDGLRDSAVPAAIMTCLTGDVVSGRLNLWGRHLRGGFRCMINVLMQQTTLDSTTSSLCQQYLIAAAFGNFGSPSDVQLLQGGILDEELYMEECHGLTRGLVSAVAATNHVAASKKRHNAAVVEKLRQQVSDSLPRLNGRFRQHLAMVYWYAAMIHFTRTVLQSNDTIQLATKAIDCLERAKETGEGLTGRIMMWPLLKIGQECKTSELRSRLFTWCNSQLGVDDIETFLKTLSSTWSVSDVSSELSATFS